MLHSNNCFIEQEMSPWKNPTEIAVNANVDSFGEAEWQTEDTAWCAIKSLNISMWHQGVRNWKQSYNKQTEVTTSENISTPYISA